jgi:hypothetical protein
MIGLFLLMGSLKLGGVLFVVYSNDHPPRHVHGFSGDTEAIVDWRRDGAVALADPTGEREEIRHQENSRASLSAR